MSTDHTEEQNDRDELVEPSAASAEPMEPPVAYSGEIDLSAAAGAVDHANGSRAKDVKVMVFDDGPIRCVAEPTAESKRNAPTAIVPVAPANGGSMDFGWHSSAPYVPLSLSTDARMPATPLVSTNGKGMAGLKDLQKIHRLLRGRYLYALLLAVVLGTIGLYFGYRSGVRTYSSTGTIRIMPTVPKVLYQIDEKGSLPMYETFVDAQISLLKSQRVMEQALDEAEWKKVAPEATKSDAALAGFQSMLQITRQGELIWVRAFSTEPKYAVAAVKSTIAAYQKVYAQLEAQADDRRREARLATHESRRADYNTLNDRIKAASKDYGTRDLKSEFDSKQKALQQLETMLRDVKVSQAMLKGAPAEVPQIKGPEDLAFRFQNGAVIQLMDRRADCEREVKAAIKRFGEKSDATAHAKANLDDAQTRLDNYVEGYRKFLQENPQALTTEDPKQLELRAHELQALYDTVKREMLAVGTQEMLIADLTQQAAEAKRKLDVAEQAIDEAEVESQVMGRIVVMGDGDRPLGAARDTRMSTAAAGGMAGAGFGIGAIVLLALLNSKMERPDDVEAQDENLPLLGLVPVLPEDVSDPEQAALTAHCVHEIRIRLQLLVQGQRRPTFGITSATAGAGKTSLATALGLSFAANHQRTLLIDCDVIGGGLTRKMDAIARRRLGAILLQERIVTEQQLAHGLRLAREGGQPLGQTLIDLGYVTADALSNAVHAQEHERMGLLDALDGQDVLSCVASTGMNNLFVMPLGNATAHDAAGLSIAGFRRLLERASRCFDVVIVDTGPILGSLEAAVVASQTDAVVLAVAKGESKSVIERAMSHLAVVGTTVAGMVFNRARGQDVVAYSSSYKSARPGSNGGVMEHKPVPGAKRLGPVANAVASWSPGFGVTPRRKRSRQRVG